jgi:hypothetical protein
MKSRLDFSGAGSLFVLLVIVLSVLLLFMDSDYPFGIFKLFLEEKVS